MCRLRTSFGSEHPFRSGVSSLVHLTVKRPRDIELSTLRPDQGSKRREEARGTNPARIASLTVLFAPITIGMVLLPSALSPTMSARSFIGDVANKKTRNSSAAYMTAELTRPAATPPNKVAIIPPAPMLSVLIR